MSVLGRAAALAVAAVLAAAGLEKARSGEATASTLRELGAPDGAARWAVPLIVLAELSVAAGLLWRPGAAATAAGVALLGTAFAAAGAVALAREEEVRCGCLGAGGEGTLGGRQVAALPAWLGAAALVGTAAPPAVSGLEATASLAGVGLVLAGARAVPLARAWRRSRGDRLSARRMYGWQS